MRTLAFLMLLASLLLPAPAVAGPAPTEFRGIAFGSPLESVEGLTSVATKVEKGAKAFKDVYYREDEDLRFGDAELRSVAYYFREGKLRSVKVVVDGDVNGFLVKEQLIKTYGQGRQIGPMYGWTWEEFSLVMERMAGEDVNVVTYTWEPRSKKEE